jgi:hypothetical protein
MSNVPDDWGCYYRWCERCGERYHLSEGGCDCDPNFNQELAERLEDTGYEYDREDHVWHKTIKRTTHTCRRAHKDGTIKKGDRYAVWTIRTIDNDGGSTLNHTKHILRRTP